MDEEETDIIYIQEPYIGGNKIVGIPRSFTVLVPGGGNIRTAIVINNKHIDAIPITQLSDEDATIMETRVGKVTFIIASMYFDIKRSIDEDLKKMHAVLKHVNGSGMIFSIDSNARSTTWHDVLTNKRQKAGGFPNRKPSPHCE